MASDSAKTARCSSLRPSNGSRRLPGLTAGIWYLVHSTLASAALFLAVDLIGTRRRDASLWLRPAPPIAQAGIVAALFFAAAIGIVVALVGGPAWAGADDIAAAVAAVFIAWNGWRILNPALLDLMDTQPPPDVLELIRSTAADVDGVDLVQKTLVRRMGNQFLVDMHVHVNPQFTVERSHRIAHAVKDAVRERLPSVLDVLIHIEPTAADRTPIDGRRTG